MYGKEILEDLANRIVAKGELPSYAVYVLSEESPTTQVAFYEQAGLFFDFGSAMEFLNALDVPQAQWEKTDVVSICLVFGEDTIPAAEIAALSNDHVYWADIDWLADDVLERIIKEPAYWCQWLEETQIAFGEEIIDDLSLYFTSQTQ